MNRQYLNLTAGAWLQFRRNWQLRPSPFLLWQTMAPGTLLSLSSRLQRVVTREELAQANLKNAIVILGYWRSGTTLLHELLCQDRRYSFPSTHACMNPQHFLLTEAAALAQNPAGVRRPMDDMEIRPGSPQEDEFALLSLGARSPYEALLVPRHLKRALELADPADLKAADRTRWQNVFLDFARGVSVRGGRRPLVLKSPTHGFRVAILRELLPDARFILISRNPVTHFESVIKMWRKMFETYSREAIPSDDEIREAVLPDRLRFEAKLTAGVDGLPETRFAQLTYESLVADPVRNCERLYAQLELGDFESVRASICAETDRRHEYKAQSRGPSPSWRQRINKEWEPVFSRYGYSPS